MSEVNEAVASLEEVMTDEQREFRDMLDKFCAETQLSSASTAALMDVNPGSMSKWYRMDPTSGKFRFPQQYVLRALVLKMRKLNAMNEENGLYAQLRGLKPRERVAYLQNALDSGYVS